MKSGLLIIDMQRAFNPPLVLAAGIQAAFIQHEVVVATRFFHHKGSLFERKLNYKELQNEGLAAKLAFISTAKVQVWDRWDRYGLLPEQIEKLKELADRWTLVGMDADACVAAIAFQLWDAGVDFTVDERLVGSSGGPAQRDAGLRVMARQFKQRLAGGDGEIS